jgi:hypothetical protein
LFWHQAVAAVAVAAVAAAAAAAATSGNKKKIGPVKGQKWRALPRSRCHTFSILLNCAFCYNFDLAFIHAEFNWNWASYSHGHSFFHYPIPVVFIFKFAVVRERQLPVQPLQRGVRAKCPSSSRRLL